jgi:hypothetical protein
VLVLHGQVHGALEARVAGQHHVLGQPAQSLLDVLQGTQPGAGVRDLASTGGTARLWAVQAWVYGVLLLQLGQCLAMTTAGTMMGGASGVAC